MASLTNQKQDGVKIFDIITKDAEEKLLSVTNKLGIDKFVFENRTKSSLTFYDTPDNLLTRTGILLYKTFEGGEYFFKLEKLNFLPRVSRLRQESIFSHKVTAKDTPKSQAFYIINGITSLFTTQFSIDLENIVKVAVPKLEVLIQGTQLKGFKGNGFKCIVEFQRVKYHNFTTKRKFENAEVTITHTSPKNFAKDFDGFLELVDRYCKDILPKTENRFEYGNRLTQIISKQKKTKKPKDAKKSSVETTIQG